MTLHPHPHPVNVDRWEWLTERELTLELIERTVVTAEDRLTDEEIAETRRKQKERGEESFLEWSASAALSKWRRTTGGLGLTWTRALLRCRTRSSAALPRPRTSGSVPAAAAARPQPSLLPVMNALPSAEVANARLVGLSASPGSARYSARPRRPISQPTPAAPGPIGVPMLRQVRRVGEREPRAAADPSSATRTSTQLRYPPNSHVSA